MRTFQPLLVFDLALDSLSDIHNDYLVNVRNETSFLDDMLGSLLDGEKASDTYPYLTDSEAEKVKPAFDGLFSALKTRETEKGVELYEPESITYTAKVGGIYEVQGREGEDDHAGRGGTARESGGVDGNIHPNPKTRLQRVALRRTGTVATATTTVKNAADAAHVMAALRKEPQENIAAIVLDKNNKIISIIHHSIGGRASTTIECMTNHLYLQI